MTEAELAQGVVAWLVADGWDVYPEVQMPAYDNRADIVAVRDNRRWVWVIEVKRGLGFAVLDQASDWQPYAHWTSVAVPSRRCGGVATRCLTAEGIGLLEISYIGTGVHVREWIEPRRNEGRYADRLLACLTEAHRALGVAGSKDQYYTPFRATCDEVRRYVGEHPGCTIRELIDHIKTHYNSTATARSCIAGYVSRGEVRGVGIVPSSRPFRLVLTGDSHAEASV